MDGLTTLQFGPHGLVDVYQRAPARVTFPRADVPTAVLVSTCGGLTGGDRLAIRAQVDDGGEAVITTQAAEKLYRSDGADVSLEVELRVGDAVLHWVPQETIVFDGARLVRRTDVHLGAAAQLHAVDIRVFGRRASGERWRVGRLDDRWQIWRDGTLLWRDAVRLDDPSVELADPFRFADAEAYGTALFVGPELVAARDRVRAVRAECAFGCTVVNGVLVTRALGDAVAVRRAIGDAYVAASGQPLPRTWAL